MKLVLLSSQGKNLPVLSGQILLSQTWLLGEYEIKQVEEESYGYRLSYLVTSSPLVAVVCSTPPRKGILECFLAPPKCMCMGGSPALGIVKRKLRSNGAHIFSWTQEVQMVGINLPSSAYFLPRKEGSSCVTALSVRVVQNVS